MTDSQPLVEKLEKIEEILYWSYGELYGKNFIEVCHLVRDMMGELGVKQQYEEKCEEM